MNLFILWEIINNKMLNEWMNGWMKWDKMNEWEFIYLLIIDNLFKFIHQGSGLLSNSKNQIYVFNNHQLSTKHGDLFCQSIRKT